MIAPLPTIRKATAIRKVKLSSRLIYRHMAKLKRKLSGDRTATRITIIKAFWTLVTSVVIRVTKRGTLNWSRWDKGQVWRWVWMAAL